MASLKARTRRAVALHRQAAAVVAAVGTALDSAPTNATDERDQRELADQLTAAASALAPGWLGASLSGHSTYPARDGEHLPRYVRIGSAEPLPGVRFPAVVPLVGTGHLVLDADAGDTRVAGLLRSLLLRLLASAPAGSLLVRGIAGASAEKVFEPFAALADAGLLPPPAVDRAGLLTVLAEAERWVRPRRAGGTSDRQRERNLLLVVAGLPADSEPTDLSRLLVLARDGVPAGLHLVVAGWPTEPTEPTLRDPGSAGRDPEPGRHGPGPVAGATGHASGPVSAVRQTADGSLTQLLLPRPLRGLRQAEAAGAASAASAPIRAIDAPDATRRGPTGVLRPTLRTPVGAAAVAARNAGPARDGRTPGPVAIAATCEPRVPPLAEATTILVREAYALVGDPPGASFGGRGPRPFSTGLNAPVLLDVDPPRDLIDRVCRDLARRFAVGCRPRFADLIPGGRGYWAEDAADGLTTVVGHDGDTPVTLRFTDRTPHWLIAGRPGAGSSAFLSNVLYGLAARYRPESLDIRLLSVRPGPAFAEFLPSSANRSWLPHVRTAGVAADREYALTLLRGLDAELDRRAAAAERTGLDGPTDVTGSDRPPRILCVIDGAPALLVEGDRMARETLRLLESVARRGRSYGVHLVLIGRPTEVPGGAYPEQVLGQFPVRVALPGGGDVLEPANDSAAGLPVGSAVVNTAGGLGGPRGATRGHERTVRFPDPAADMPDRDELRNRLWLARPRPDDRPDEPRVFDGAVPVVLDEDPTYRAVLAAGAGPPVALLGRSVDATSGTATFALDDSPGRHLAVVGRSPAGAEALAAAARSVAAAHPPGGTRFAVASFLPEAEPVADALVTALRMRHEVEVVDAPGLAARLADDRSGHLVVFGMDAAGPADLPPQAIRSGLRTGPARGVHLLSWWRRTRRLVELAGDGSLTEYVAGLLLLDLPPIEAEYLLGRDADWRPRPGRATLADRDTGEVRLIVPFGGGAR